MQSMMMRFDHVYRRIVASHRRAKTSADSNAVAPPLLRSCPTIIRSKRCFRGRSRHRSVDNIHHTVRTALWLRDDVNARGTVGFEVAAFAEWLKNSPMRSSEPQSHQ